MAFVTERREARDDAPEFQKVACVLAICALATFPLAFCAALTIWGS
ncbi:hypothetical protein LG047_09670 [Methylocystis sp. WRRC1]|nr:MULTISPECIES: hypothetical protein [unclassified Methylocystis]MCC3245587.1 hypothetical protein [Methylocystis sp. WRRC1]